MKIVTTDKKIYLGGYHEDNENACVLASTAQEEPLLQCHHEEADDRIMFHLAHGVKVDKYQNIMISSPDTDVLICATYNLTTLLHFGLQQLWFVTGKSNNRKSIPLHKTLELLDPDVVDILPALHALTGCDSTNKVATKLSAVRLAREGGNSLLHSFGRGTFTDEILYDSEKFLVKCISPKSISDTFDDLRYEVYHDKKFKFDLVKFPPTSKTIKEHIKRAYFQCHLWQHASYIPSITLNPLEYGYVEDEDGKLMSIVTTEWNLPGDFLCLVTALNVQEKTYVLAV